MTVERAASLQPGDHGTTYGGNPLAAAAINRVFEIYEQENILENVKLAGEYLGEQLDKLTEKYQCITEHRGMGLMRGIEMNISVLDVAKSALKHGLILITAGTNVIRMVPPLIVTKENIDEMIGILEVCIQENCSHK